MPAGAAAGKNDMDGVCLHGNGSLSVNDTFRMSGRDTGECQTASPSAISTVPLPPSPLILPASSFSDAVPSKAAQGRGDPEADDDFVLGPAEELKMVMQRRTPQQAAPPPLVVTDLNDNAHGLGDEYAADDHQQQLLPGDDGQHPQQCRQRQAPVLPMNTWAGWQLNQRKPSTPPIMPPAKTVISPAWGMRGTPR